MKTYSVYNEKKSISVEAINKQDALKKAIKTKDLKKYVDKARKENRNPFSGWKVKEC